MNSPFRDTAAQDSIVRNALRVLVPGFALMMMLLVASGYVGIRALQTTEQEAARQALEQQAIIRLIDDIQREENSLSDIFYELAQGAGPEKKRALIEQLSLIAEQVRQTTETGMSASDAALWRRVRDAADAFIEEVRRSATPADLPFHPSAAFFQHHDALIDALGDLTAATYQEARVREERRHQESAGRLKQALLLLVAAVLLGTVVAALTIRFSNNLFRRVQWQNEQLVRLSRHMIEEQENTARRFSHELHDDLGQTLSAIEASLIAMRRQGPDLPERLEDCLALVKDAIGNVRDLSQLLRPSILDDFGLRPALQWLTDGFSQRTGIRVECTLDFDGRLLAEVETHLFRIAQEALTNIASHSGATQARLALAVEGAHLVLAISDNGTGFVHNHKRPGLGLLGMRARAQSAGGECIVESKLAHGVSVRVRIPIRNAVNRKENPSTTG